MPKDGPRRRLAQADQGVPADPVERVAKSHRGRGLALAGGRRGDGGDQDQPARGPILQGVDAGERDLGLVVAVGFEMAGIDAEPLPGELGDRPQRRGLGYLDIGLGHGRHVSSSRMR